jgi:ribosomal protein S18 acetylase RimI-like enzyme
VAENVNGFLADGRYQPGLKHGISSTYLLLDQEVDPLLIGYATLTFDSVRLTNAEKKQMEELVGISQFGAVRIQMIGIDHRHQNKGHGAQLLEAITGVARRLSEVVAVRFLLADANIHKVGWYEARGFVVNKAKRVCAASLLVGHAFLSSIRPGAWSWLEPGVGFALLVGVGGGVAWISGSGLATSVALLALVLAAILVCLLSPPAVEGWPAAAAIGVRPRPGRWPRRSSC